MSHRRYFPKGLIYSVLAGVLCFCCSPVSALEIIVDDDDANTSSVGEWVKVKGPKNIESSWEESSVRNELTGRFRWHPDIPVAGEYTVYAWWTSGRKRSDYALFMVSSDEGITKIRVDQNNYSSGGKWNKLGIFTFSAGSSQYIQVRGQSTPGKVSADAVRLVKVGSPPSTLNGFDHISENDWDETAVRKVLHVFAYGGQSTDAQITARAGMAPVQAITEILTFGAHNDKLSPPEDATRNTNGTLEDLQTFWSSDDPANPVRPDRNAYEVFFHAP